jgi:LPXTG-site transpeptidase (sortase) family protein
MYPRGIIYDSQKGKTSGVTYLHQSFRKKITLLSLRGLGAGLIAYFIIGFIFSLAPIVSSEIKYQSGQKNTPVVVDNTMYKVEAESINEVQKEALDLGLDSYFSLYIPKIDARSEVIPNVDTANEEEYFKALGEGVAHAKGTYFPGQGKTIYLFAHSTDSPLNVARYNAVFYLLRKLAVGDQIVVFFADKKYVYQVEETQITEANDTTWLTKDFGSEKLILQTCYPPGTRLKRLIVVAGLLAD